MRYWALISISILLIPFLFGIDEANAATWYNSSWLKARKITIDQTDIDTADLTNYPLYVNMTSVNIGTDAQADCDDFVFTDSTNVTKLDHEIETCSDASNWAEFWVEIPTVSNTVDTVIYMYYDNAAATDQQNTQATWNSNFKAVWHLNGTFIDSTSSPTTCTNSGTSAATTEYIGDSRDWDKVDDFIDCGSDSKTDNIWESGGTISLWAKPASAGELNSGNFVHRAFTNGWYTAINGEISGSTERFEFHIDGTTDGSWKTTNYELKNGMWKLITITYDKDSVSNDPIFYVNGSSVGVTQTGVNPVGISSDDTIDICLGNTHAASETTCATTITFDDKMDEFRFVDTILPANWIKADWECQKGAVTGQAGQSCITVGSQGTEPVSGSTVTVTDEYALEDSVSIIAPGNVVVSDEYALEDSVSATAANTVNPTDEYALEDSVSIPGNIVVTDEFALEDSAGTNQITVNDEFALEDTVQGSATTAIRNAIVIYLNTPTTTRLGGVLADVCNYAANYSMVGIYPNGSAICYRFP